MYSVDGKPSKVQLRCLRELTVNELHDRSKEAQWTGKTAKHKLILLIEVLFGACLFGCRSLGVLLNNNKGERWDFKTNTPDKAH